MYLIMKKLIFVFAFLFSIILSVSSQTKGSTVVTNQQCLSATTEDNFSEMNRVCNKKDESSLKQMISVGKVYVLSKNTKAVVVDSGFGKKKITTSNGLNVWVSSEFLSTTK